MRTELQNDLYNFLIKGGVHTSEDLAKHFDLTINGVRSLIRALRKRFNEGDEDISHYIFTTQAGYSTDEKPEYCAYEAGMRFAQGTGVLINGVYVFKRTKKFAVKEFSRLRIQYKPRILALEKIVT